MDVKRTWRISPATCWLVLTLIQICVTGNNKWCPKQCDCFNSFTTVDCSMKELKELPQLSNITQVLYLENNRLKTLSNGALKATSQLLILNAMNNSLTTIKSETLCRLQKVRELDFSNNKIASFSIPTPDGACVLAELRTLTLSGNRLQEIPRNLSTLAPELGVLSLSQNDIRSAHLDESYSDMLSLQHLDLSKNHIYKIDASDFASIRGIPLEILLLSDCGIVMIDPLALQGMDNLTFLSFSRSPIQMSTLEQVFANIGNASKMARLELSEMQLPNVTSAMLGMFHHLLIIEMKNSEVEHFDPAIFDHLTNIETLHLEHNQIRRLDNIAASKKLRRLHLQRNHLRGLELVNLPDLEYVDLSQNNITDLPTDWLRASDTLNILNVSHNRIRSIQVDTFNKVTLHTLDLSYNRLVSIHRYGLVKLRNLDLSHNQLNYITDNAFDDLDKTIEELDLSYNNFTRFPSHTFHDFISLQRLYLRHNQLGEAFRRGTQGNLFHSLGHLQVLDLSYNGITVLPHQQFQYLHHLTTLFLTGNKIMDLADLSLPDMSSLAKLVVSNNMLPSVETHALSKLEYLEVADLSNNPYQCTCNLMPFLHWLNTTLVTVLNIKNYNKYTCNFPPNKSGWYIREYHPSQMECVQPDNAMSQNFVIFAVISGSVAALVAIMALIFYYGQVCHRIKSLHYRWQIRYREVSGVEFTGDTVKA